jgi:hypothetical protein
MFVFPLGWSACLFVRVSHKTRIDKTNKKRQGQDQSKSTGSTCSQMVGRQEDCQMKANLLVRSPPPLLFASRQKHADITDSSMQIQRKEVESRENSFVPLPAKPREHRWEEITATGFSNMAQESIRSAPGMGSPDTPALRCTPMAPAFENDKIDPDPDPDAENTCATARLLECPSQDTDNEHAKIVDFEDRMAEQGNESHALIRDTKGIRHFTICKIHLNSQ